MLQTVLILAATSGVMAPAKPVVKKVQKSVTVVVDYVNISSTEFDTAWRKIPKGKDHDANLLQALSDNGGADVKGARVTVKPDQLGCSETKTMAHASVIVNGKAQSVFLDTTFRTEVTPHFQPDGTLALRMKLHKTDNALDSEASAPREDLLLTTALLLDGQTKLIDGTTSSKWLSGKGAKTKVHEPWKQLIFVTATVTDR